MGKKSELSELNEAWLLVPDRSISENADLLRFSHITISRFYKEKKNYPVSSNSRDENALLMLEVRGEWPDCAELIGQQQQLI